MIRFFLLLGVFVLTQGAFAAGKGLSNLKQGDTFQGTDQVSKEECVVEILNNSKDGLALRLSVGDKSYEDFVISKKIGITSEKFSDEIVRQKNDEYSALVTVDAYLKESKISGKRNLSLVQTWWFEHTYQTQSLVDCDLQ